MDHCIDENLLVRFAGGELGDQQEADVRKHLAICSTCTTRLASFRSTWDLLGEWTITPPPVGNMVARVMAEAKRRPGFGSWMPVAAAAALAAGLGIAAGALTSRNEATMNTRLQAVSSEQLVQLLGLDALGDDSTALEQLFTPGEDEEQS